VSENLDLVRSIYADWERGDFHRTDWADSEIEFAFVGGPNPGGWTGLAGLAEGVRQWMNAWEDVRVEMEGYRELDDGRVLVLTGARGRGKRSGLDLGEVGTHHANLWHIREAKVTRLGVYWDIDRALADLGLGE
jgi:ketosteroid isomerase-like protein